MAEAAALVRTIAVGRYRATFVVQQPRRGQVLNVVVEWEPRVPSRLSGPQLRAYRRGRDQVIAEIAQALGGSAVVAEA